MLNVGEVKHKSKHPSVKICQDSTFDKNIQYKYVFLSVSHTIRPQCLSDTHTKHLVPKNFTFIDVN